MTRSPGVEGGAVCAARGCGALSQAIARADRSTESRVVPPRVMRQASRRVAAFARSPHTAEAIIFHFARRGKEQNRDDPGVGFCGSVAAALSRIIVLSCS